ncbi:MAG: hydrogenase small subunit [Gammaproteobacteria bacterium]|nr:hydrogenase small subunit [Gammaproteobacteria bacterium]
MSEWISSLSNIHEAATPPIGINRREFIKFCTGVAATMGLAPAMSLRIAEAATKPQRPPVIWISAQECTGCTESLLRSTHPTLEQLILEHISLDYHEALAAGAGDHAEAHKHSSMHENKGRYVLVVDGAIPTKDDGIYCKVADKTILQHVREAVTDAGAIIAIGSCAAWGGIPSSGPNPTDAKGLGEIVTDKQIVNIPGCPPNPYNFLATVLYFLTFNKLPELDDKGRPKFAYGQLIHENCERRPHYDAGRFAIEFGDEGHRQGWCLYKMGCKGPETHANCPSILYGEVGSGAWPVGTGHPCFGCTEQGVGFTKPIHELSDVSLVTPPNSFTDIFQTKGQGVSVGAAALASGAVGAALGASAVIASRLGKHEEGTSEPQQTD